MTEENSFSNNPELTNKTKIEETDGEIEQSDVNNPGRLLTLDDVLEFGEKYYDEHRWETYYVPMFEELENFPKFGNVLEIGPYKSPLIENSDVIDKNDYSDDFPFNINNVIIHDCSVTPYPIEDKKYDLVLASQVMEHLGVDGQQVDVFKELARISNKAIISLPYKWFRPFHRSHHMIDEKVFDAWQGEFEPISEKITESIIIRSYDFTGHDAFVNTLSITASDVHTNYKDGTFYEVQLVDDDGNPCALANQVIKITILGKEYNRKTDSDGVARLPINLIAGNYTIEASFKDVTIDNDIVVNKG